MAALEDVCNYTRGKAIVVLIGAPLKVDNDLFNCAFVLTDGEVMGVVPKVNLPNTGEFYEKRWFTSGRATREFTPGGMAPRIPTIELCAVWHGPAVHHPQLLFWHRGVRGPMESATAFDATGDTGRRADLQPLVEQLHRRQECLPSPDDHPAVGACTLWLYIHLVGYRREYNGCGLLGQYVYRRERKNPGRGRSIPARQFDDHSGDRRRASAYRSSA